ncbi:tsr1 ribosome assembly factor [Rhodnius prolixus]|uniref:Pre-rRNA-processing protein TSR1 homolog n=2 Tax=Rhodnius TaxID=13248 RepID=R4FLD4_RHOPR
MGLETIHEHRPGSLKQINKLHKHGRHRSKGTLERLNKGRALMMKIPGRRNKDLTKEERRNQTQQIRKKKRFEYLQKRRGFCETPFLVAIITLNEKINADDVLDSLKVSDPEAQSVFTPQGYLHLKSPRLKQKFTFAISRGDNLFDKLDLLKVATSVLLITSVDGMDDNADIILSSAISQGLPTTTVVVSDLHTLPQKKWQETKNQIQKDLEHWLPSLDKVMTIEKTGDGLNILRKLGFQKQRSVTLRDRRPHLLAEALSFTETEMGKGTLKVTGYLRGRNLNVNGLVHIPGWGDFQMLQIDAAQYPGEEMAEPSLLEKANPELQVSLESENNPDPMDAEQTWPTEEEIAAATSERKKEKNKVKKVPHGMSDYQAAWIPDCDAVEIDYDSAEEEEDNVERMEASEEAESSDEEIGMEEDSASVATEITVSPEKYDREIDCEEEKAALEKARSAKDDQQFPDEIDTPHDVPARERFMKYRGLKSFRTSPWHPKENLPSDYARIFQFQNFKRTKAAAVLKADIGVQVGLYITVHVADVPSIYFHTRGTQPVVLYGLLDFENKMSVVNTVLKRCHGSDQPIASKEPLVFQIGYRRFRACPLFSQHTNGNKHKYERFFHPDAIVVATVYAPTIYPPASVLAFKENRDKTMEAVAHGSVLSVDPDRIILKRVVLSGHPMKVLKRSAIIRFMFFNREDINWFKPIELRTKYGRRGHIKEPLGTHGHMKCVFNAQLKSQDTVLLQLYKRVFPKWTYDPFVNFAPILET